MRFRADFNDIEGEDGIVLSYDDADVLNTAMLGAGTLIQLYDDEPDGHSCRAYVVAVDSQRRLVEARIDWPTWRSPRVSPEPRPVVLPARFWGSMERVEGSATPAS